MREIELFDYHTHAVEHGIDKPMRVEEMVTAAVEKGLKAICLTDHFPLPPGFVDPVPEQDCAMSEANYKIYQRKVNKIAQQYSDQITVLNGAEVDFLPEYEEWTRSQLPRFGFDYVIGSVHFVGNNGKQNLILDYDEDGFAQCVEYYGGIENLTKDYYERERKLAKSGIFDGVGHLDLVKKYNLDEKYFRGNEEWYRNEVSSTLDVISRANMVIELNTSGWDKKCEEQYPSFWILEEANKKKIALTISSDAHVPANVGKNLDRAVSLARQAGFTSLVRFEKRQKKEVRI